METALAARSISLKHQWFHWLTGNSVWVTGSCSGGERPSYFSAPVLAVDPVSLTSKLELGISLNAIANPILRRRSRQLAVKAQIGAGQRSSRA